MDNRDKNNDNILSNNSINESKDERKISTAVPITIKKRIIAGIVNVNNVCKECASECLQSSEVMFSNKLTGLLLCGPIALIGGKNGLDVLGEPTCFALAGIALIPCAERLSFITEEVAAHTNETFGALLNATFGNAPELLISTAALRSGFYRVVQLTSLGSIITNLLFVFGISSFIGGLRWQVQEVRLTSGNVSVGMLLIATTGLILPAALKLSNAEMFTKEGEADASLLFSRFNALIMISMYFAYLFFQLATHKEEFDDNYHNQLSFSNNSFHQHGHDYDSSHKLKNIWCNRYVDTITLSPETLSVADLELELKVRKTQTFAPDPLEINNDSVYMSDSNTNSTEEDIENNVDLSNTQIIKNVRCRSIDKPQSLKSDKTEHISHKFTPTIFVQRSCKEDVKLKRTKSDSDLSETDILLRLQPGRPQISLRAGIFWLLTVTICISAMSDIVVDTIDGFAQKSHISEIFTSIIIIPFFSNIAEQVSAVIFAYRNKMDLCVGITAGSAIQISLCVLPGSVLIGWAMDRSMSLFFHGFETCCLLMAVLSVSVILQGGTTNWLAGLFFIAIYLMIAAGFWFHLREDLSTDEEFLLDKYIDNISIPIVHVETNQVITTDIMDLNNLGEGN